MTDSSAAAQSDQPQSSPPTAPSGGAVDPRDAFMAGANGWARRKGQPFDRLAARAASEHAYPGGRFEVDPPGTWPAAYVGRGFVEGAKWQECSATGGTMWQSDQRDSEEEAARRYPLAAEAGEPA